MFLVHVEAEPTAASPKSHDIAGADVHVFVQAESIEDAKRMAIEYLIDYAWVTKAVERAVEILPEHAARMDTLLKSDYLKAGRDGIAASFFAWPKEPRPGVYERRSLGPPVNRVDEH